MPPPATAPDFEPLPYPAGWDNAPPPDAYGPVRPGPGPGRRLPPAGPLPGPPYPPPMVRIPALMRAPRLLPAPPPPPPALEAALGMLSHHSAASPGNGAVARPFPARPHRLSPFLFSALRAQPPEVPPLPPAALRTALRPLAAAWPPGPQPGRTAPPSAYPGLGDPTPRPHPVQPGPRAPPMPPLLYSALRAPPPDPRAEARGAVLPRPAPGHPAPTGPRPSLRHPPLLS
eukprot:EG_transcript_8235